MVHKNLNFLFRSFKIMVILLKGLNYYQNFFIVDFVVYLRRCKFLIIKGNGMEFFSGAFLGKNYP